MFCWTNLIPGAAATSPPPPVIFSQVAASRFRGAPPPPPVIFASRRPRHIFWQTTIFTYGSDEIAISTMRLLLYDINYSIHWHMHSLGSFRDTPDSKLLQWRSQDFEVGGTMASAKREPIWGPLHWGRATPVGSGAKPIFFLEFTPL
jgi:hypothetical protein